VVVQSDTKKLALFNSGERRQTSNPLAELARQWSQCPFGSLKETLSSSLGWNGPPHPLASEKEIGEIQEDC